MKFILAEPKKHPKKKAFKLSFFIFLFFSFFVMNLGASTPRLTSLDPLILSLQSRYQSMKTLKADFTQTAFRHNIMGQLEKIVQKGELQIKKPGKLRWDFLQPDKRLYISNGQTLWIYSPKENQVIERKWNAEEVALQFLLGIGKISDDFNYRNLNAEEKIMFSAHKGHWIYLTPKKEKIEDFGSLQALVLNVHPSRGLVQDAWILDPIGSKTHWHFEKIRLDKEIQDGTFQFKIPKNVQVLNY